ATNRTPSADPLATRAKHIGAVLAARRPVTSLASTSGMGGLLSGDLVAVKITMINRDAPWGSSRIAPCPAGRRILHDTARPACLQPHPKNQTWNPCRGQEAPQTPIRAG